jgi:predicted nucleotidyltransferase/DNA-binding XRE family transcriptional regulator
VVVMSSTGHDAGTFGHVLTAARRRAGLTQAQLAEGIGTTQAAITRLERGRFRPAVGTLERLAAALGVTFEIGEQGLTVRTEPRRPATLADLRARRDEILQVAAAEGARNLRVFGSVARGEAGAESDIDFVVDFEPGYSLMNVSGLQIGLEHVLDRKVHVVTLPSHASSIRERRMTERIQREAVAL